MADTSELSTILGFLNHLSIDDLKDVLNDDNKFEEITKDPSNKVKESQASDKDIIMASNRSLGEYIVAVMNQLPELKINLSECYDKLRDFSDSVNSKLAQLRDCHNTVDENTMLVMLQSATTTLEEDTDRLSEKFLDGEINLEQFLDEYQTQKKSLFIRKAKLEKLNTINSRRNSRLRPAPTVPSVTHNSGLHNSMYPSPVSNFPSSIQPMQMPYPLGPSSMPMPGASFVYNHF